MKNLLNIKLVSPNITFSLQTMNQEVICIFKSYKNFLLLNFVNSMDEGQFKLINVNDFIHMNGDVTTIKLLSDGIIKNFFHEAIDESRNNKGNDYLITTH